MLHLRKIALFLAVVFCISLAGCSADAPQSKAAGSIDQTAVYRQNSASRQTQNLAKVCKVWGYAKYYHPAFLLGTSDWDAELLSLLSKVSACETSDDVNALLHEWFTSLGEIDYKARIPKAASGSDASVSEADLSWTADADYLGEALVGDLAKLPTMLPTNLDRTHAPVFFDSLGVPDFSNEPEHGSDYTDPDFRLLGAVPALECAGLLCPLPAFARLRLGCRPSGSHSNDVGWHRPGKLRSCPCVRHGRTSGCTCLVEQYGGGHKAFVPL